MPVVSAPSIRSLWRLCGLLLPGGGGGKHGGNRLPVPEGQTGGLDQGPVSGGRFPHPRGICPLLLHPHLPPGRHSGRHHPPGGSAQGGNQANCGGSGPGLLPHQNHRTHHRNCPRPEQPGGVPGVHPGLPVLSGRLLLPARCGGKVRRCCTGRLWRALQIPATTS